MQPYFQVAPDVRVTIKMSKDTSPMLLANDTKQGTKMWLLHIGNLVADEGIFLPLVCALFEACEFQ
jgi:hypothetical protein